ncbi:MAG: N-acetylmuramoyl-L-alanine amidase family protein, partial [Alkalispirochaeta sp.]
MGKGRSGFNAVIALLFLVSTASLYSQQSASSSPEVVDVTEVISRTETRFQWDPYREQGTLVRGSSMLTFRVGTPLAVGNLTEIHRITPPERRDGTIVFDRDFLALAMRLFPRVDEMRRIAGIFIDPGHGGKDPGAVGTITGDEEIRTIQEKDVVLAVGRTLRDLLVQRYPDKQILMSRDAD